MRFFFSRAMAFLVLSSVFVFAATSCKKSSNNSSASGMSATVSGTAWTPNYPTTAFYAASDSEFFALGLQYKNGDSTGFQLMFFSPFALNKTISTDTSSMDVQYFVANTQSIQEYDGSPAAGGHALLTVTSYDPVGHKIGGTFSGVLYNSTGGTDSVVVTNGSFNTSYTVQ